jgi:lipid-A-disaccharide synthase
LVNILAQTEVIRELVANDFKEEKIIRELERILSDEAYKKNMLASYEHIHSLLGEHSAAETAAQIITSIYK